MHVQRVSPSAFSSPVFIFNPTPISSLAFQPTFNLAGNRDPIFGLSNSLKWAPNPRVCSRSCPALFTVRAGMVDEVDDGFYMRRCVEIARKAIGCTSPNPMVGCVIVKDGKVVGEGFHPKAGQPHAEVFALRDAGELAEGATAYVSLEPCNHYGRTPPCTEALINAKVKKVVVGMVDPNPIVASKGVERLRGAGISVTVGVEEELCQKLNEAYIHKMLTGKPFLTLRYSLSVNGSFLDQLGEGVSESGGYYSKLLQEYDAIIISSTLQENLVSIASKEAGANQPIRIIVAGATQQSFIHPDPTEESARKVVVFTDKETNGEKGIETVIPERMNLDSILEYCQQRGLCSLLLDLRGNCCCLQALLEEGLEKNLLKKIVVEVLPVWTEKDKYNVVASLHGLAKTLKVQKLQVKNSDQSVVLGGYLQF